MRFWYSFDSSRKNLFRAEVDVATAQFSIPPHLVRRITINALVFIPLLGLALYFDQVFAFWFSLAFGVGATLWQVVAYGYFRDSLPTSIAHVSTFYGKGVLVALVIFWSVLILGIAALLYNNAP